LILREQHAHKVESERQSAQHITTEYEYPVEVGAQSLRVRGDRYKWVLEPYLPSKSEQNEHNKMPKSRMSASKRPRAGSKEDRSTKKTTSAALARSDAPNARVPVTDRSTSTSISNTQRESESESDSESDSSDSDTAGPALFARRPALPLVKPASKQIDAVKTKSKGDTSDQVSITKADSDDQSDDDDDDEEEGEQEEEEDDGSRTTLEAIGLSPWLRESCLFLGIHTVSAMQCSSTTDRWLP
jgi:hypothetical protein